MKPVLKFCRVVMLLARNYFKMFQKSSSVKRVFKDHIKKKIKITVLFWGKDNGIELNFDK